LKEERITIATWKQANFKTDRLELDLLLSKVTGRSRAEIVADPQMTLSDNQVTRLNNDLRELEAGTPFAYIAGKKEFFGIELEISESVLVPRPETEILVEMVLTLAPKNATLLDMGTGSGAIALAIVSERPDIKVSASDLSARALELAKRNAKSLNLDLTFFHSNWYQSLPCIKWDFLVSNPPYISENDPHLDVLKKEPIEALVSGPDGLEAIRQIVTGSSDFLTPHGHLLIEHGFNQGQAVSRIFAANSFINIISQKDYSGIERVKLGKLNGR
jgi:release factor glutamine methyltransferase